MLDQNKLITSLYQIRAIQFGEFKLKSGEISPLYIDLRKIISYPTLLRDISLLMWEKINRVMPAKAGIQTFDLICGVPYTALPIATCLSLEHNIPMIMRRKEKKEYGTKKLIEGEFTPGQSCLIIEDVITTGSSILETVADLETVGLKIHDVIVLIDREQSAKENLKKFNVHTVLSLSQILQSLLNSTLIDHNERNSIEKYMHEKLTS